MCRCQPAPSSVRDVVTHAMPPLSLATQQKRTPLHLAAAAGHTAAAGVLVKSGGGLEVADVDGRTALHLAGAPPLPPSYTPLTHLIHLTRVCVCGGGFQALLVTRRHGRCWWREGRPAMQQTRREQSLSCSWSHLPSLTTALSCSSFTTTPFKLC